MPVRQTCRTIFSLLFLATINPVITKAQVIPDGTLPTVVEQLQNMRKITGGERVGNNLFHSFEQFSVPSGIEAIFENDPNIENIFSRITGNEASIIDGLIKTVGGANLFLLNSNGIVFGANASVDIGGSFFATTANNIQFSDGTSFGIETGHPNVTLTMTAPVGITFNGGNGSITVNGSGNQISKSSTFSPIVFDERPTGISVKDGKTLGLVGNGLILNGGVITTNGGEIYLNSINSGSLRINQTETELTLLEDNVIEYQDININQQSLIDASGQEVGIISLIGKNINLGVSSFILAQNQGNSVNGSINVKASESLTLSGNALDGSSPSAIRSEALSSEKGVDVNISTRQLFLSEPSAILANSFSEGTGGAITIEASDKIELLKNQSNSSFPVITASTFGLKNGNAGSVTISTQELKILDGGTISSATFNAGNAGNVDINADNIVVSGTKKIISQAQPVQSLINSGSVGSGNAGTVTITTSRLSIREGAAISSSSLGQGNAGTVMINASEFVEVNDLNSSFSRQNSISSSVIFSPLDQGRFGKPLTPTGRAGNVEITSPTINVSNGAIITVTNQGTGEAGILTINADNLTLDQMGNITAAAKSGIGGNIELNTQNLKISNDSQITATAGGNENGGNITINTSSLNAKKNTEITASSFEGNGGNIRLDAKSLSLNNQDLIFARSELGEGGNITINSDRLKLENGSEISTSAGGTGDGGNIKITGGNIFVLNNSNIAANAIQGNGGNIDIIADGFFVSPDSSVTAFSEFGIDGFVNITNLSDDITKKLVIKDPYIIDIDKAIADTCLSGNRSGTSFTEGATGGLPLNQDSKYRNLGSSRVRSNNLPEVNQEKQVEENPTSSEREPLIRATRMIRTFDGRIHLIASLESARDLICNGANQDQ